MAKTFRVFISSTFNDFSLERNALQEWVFPKLQELCVQLGHRFQAIDLRWGVSEEATRQNRTMQICMEELRRCQELSPRPNFLVLLGDRYGWQPLPELIPEPEYNKLVKHLGHDMAKQLEDHYELDGNALDPIYVLMSRGEEKRLVYALCQAATDAGLAENRRILYGASATHQEIFRGVLQSVDPEQHVYVFSRQFEDDAMPETGTAAKQYLDVLSSNAVHDQQAHARLKELRSSLKSKLGPNVVEYRVRWAGLNSPPTSYLGRLPDSLQDCRALLENDTPPKAENLCVDVFRALGKTILEEIQAIEELLPEDVEKKEHATFAGEAQLVSGNSNGYLLCKADQSVVDKFFKQTENGRILVVFGSVGIGKSALLANMASTCRERAEWEVVQRYVGASAISSTGSGLLSSVNTAIARLLGEDVKVKGNGNGLHALIDEFQERIRTFPPNRRLLVVLDGLDLLPDSDPLKSLIWIPPVISPYVRLLVSVDSDKCPALKHLDSSHFYEKSALGRVEAGFLLDHWLLLERRRLQPAQYESVLAAALADGLPLSLRIAFQRARNWPSFAPTETCGKDLRSIVVSWLADLQRDENHGPTLVRDFFSLLCASREGLAEDELIDLLSSNPLFEPLIDDIIRRSPNSPRNVRRLPFAPWARLYADVVPLLRIRNSVGQATVDFVHPAIRSIIKDELLLLDPDHASAFHALLASYFKLDKPIHCNSASIQRALAERPFQLAAMEKGDELSSLLMDAGFLLARIQAAGIYGLLADFALFPACLTTVSPEHARDLKALAEALQQAARILCIRPKELGVQLHWRLERPIGIDLEALLQGLRDAEILPWFRLERVGRRLQHRTLEGHSREVRLLALMLDGQVLVSGADDRTLRFWTLADGENIPKTVNYPDGRLVDMAVSPCGLYLTTGAREGVVSIWTADGSQLATSVIPEDARLQQVAISRSFLILLTTDGDLLVWCLPSASEWSELDFAEPFARMLRSANDRPGKAMDASCGSDRICVVDGDGSVFIVKIEGRQRISRSCLRTVTEDFMASSLLLSPKGDNLYVGGKNGCLWRCQFRKQQQPLWGRMGKIVDNDPHSIRALACNTKGTVLYAGSERGRIVCFALPEEQEKDQQAGLALVAEGKAVHAMCVDNLDRLICAGGTPHIRIIPTNVASKPEAMITALAMDTARNGRLAVAADCNGKVHVVDLAKRQQLHCRRVHSAQVASLVISPDGQYILAGTLDGVVACMDATQPTAFPICSVKQSGGIQCLLSSSEPDQIVAINDLDTLTVYSLPEMAKIRSWDITGFHHHRVTAAISLQTDEGWFIVTGSQSGELAVCNQDFELLDRTSLGSRRICSIVSVGQRNVLIGTDGGEIVRYSVSGSGLSEQFRFPQHSSGGVAVASLDDHGIVSVSQDSSLRLWSQANGLVATCTMDALLSGGIRSENGTLFTGDQHGQLFFGKVVVPRETCGQQEGCRDVHG